MKRILFLLAFLSFCMVSNAQFINDEEPEYQEKEPTFKDRLIYGGNLGLLIGSNTYINISPAIGYKITNSFSAGTGIIFEYMNDKRYTPTFNTSIFGGKLFAQQVLFDFAMIYGEFNILSLESKYYNPELHPEQKRFVLPVPWFGGGIYQPAGKGGVYLMVLFNLNNSPHSPYEPYEIRAGFFF